jgi:hypothetical protein
MNNLTMTQKKIITMLIITSVIVLIGFLYLGLRQFTRFIYKQRTCVWANIDK